MWIAARATLHLFEANGNNVVSTWKNALVLIIMDLSAKEASFIVEHYFKFVQSHAGTISCEVWWWTTVVQYNDKTSGRPFSQQIYASKTKEE